ncbi:CDP-alcohol phosphatidyltransferase family protein [Paractinoplanes rishiriensis]|uniref:CDP-alcohol phosphatidyltransferase n=1 Tax=Paractinoplanes rishiriensis TaxID=1050105 RepID=A0A919MVW1_9ACTN|nr:hypothetical protein Ari01nite_42990 [Actinoplanes rishiriensis]
MTWDEYAAAWSRLHGGFDPSGASGLVRGWLRLTYRIGSWLAARGVGPMAVTTGGLLLCLAVPLVVLLDPPSYGPFLAAPSIAGSSVAGSSLYDPLAAGPLLAASVVLAAALADGLDGAVAVLTGRATRVGYVYDSVADRVGELAWLAAFWLAGAPGWAVVAAGAASWLQEYARSRATAAGMTEIGVVTISERPTRVLITIFGLLLTAVLPWAPLAAVLVWSALTTVGLTQLTVTIRRNLTDG